MKISEIILCNVTTHKDTVLPLPKTGMVLITGENGSGKSSIIEAVPLTLWGKSLRGAKLWASDIAGSVIVADDTTYSRRAHGRCKLFYSTGSTEGGAGFDTTKDAQVYVTQKVGTMEQWRRSCVLSSADASNFTSATDAELKRLIEMIVGADKLEYAYRDYLEVLNSVLKKSRAIDNDLQIALVKVQEAKKRIADVASMDYKIGQSTPPDFERKEILEVAYAQIEQEIKRCQDGSRDASHGVLTADLKTKSAMSEADRLSQGDCPSCGQAIPDAMKESAHEAVGQAQAVAADASKNAETLLKRFRDEIDDLRKEKAAIAEGVRKIRDTVIRHADYLLNKSNLEKMEKAAESAAQDLAITRTDVRELEKAIEELSSEVAICKAVVQTLSTKGVRAHLVGRVIAAIEASANAWLGKICHGDLELSLKPTGMMADGKTEKAAVSLQISTNRHAAAKEMILQDETGPNGEFRGYENASAGERRRIDIAIMFALAEVAEAAAGREKSTLFCDEIFDALDADGINAVCGALDELSKDRCVIVISHTAAGRLKEVATEHWHVSDGNLQAV